MYWCLEICSSYSAETMSDVSLELQVEETGLSAKLCQKCLTDRNYYQSILYQIQY